jgi:hypothetical protein
VIAYLDSSVLLRKVLRQPGALREWAAIRTGVASALAETECLRSLDRLRLRIGLADRDLARRREAVFRLLESLDVVEVTAPVLARAAQPLPTELASCWSSWASRPRHPRAPAAARSIRSLAPAWSHGKKLVMMQRTPSCV